MGFSGEFLYGDGGWRDEVPEDEWLSISVHDSDIATVEHRRRSGEEGRFYLGFQPRDYFEDGDASEPVDLDAQAQSFAAWVKEVAGADVGPDRIRALMASDDEDEKQDTWVEDTVKRLLELAGLPQPPELAGDDT
jgi:hypothetical protein